MGENTTKQTYWVVVIMQHTTKSMSDKQIYIRIAKLYLPKASHVCFWLELHPDQERQRCSALVNWHKFVFLWYQVRWNLPRHKLERKQVLFQWLPRYCLFNVTNKRKLFPLLLESVILTQNIALRLGCGYGEGWDCKQANQGVYWTLYWYVLSSGWHKREENS